MFRVILLLPGRPATARLVLVASDYSLLPVLSPLHEDSLGSNEALTAVQSKRHDATPQMRTCIAVRQATVVIQMTCFLVLSEHMGLSHPAYALFVGESVIRGLSYFRIWVSTPDFALGGGVMSGVGMRELVIVLLVVLVIFGTKRLRTIGSDLGGAIRGFKRALHGGGQDEALLSKQGQKSEAADAAAPPDGKSTA